MIGNLKVRSIIVIVCIRLAVAIGEGHVVFLYRDVIGPANGSFCTSCGQGAIFSKSVELLLQYRFYLNLKRNDEKKIIKKYKIESKKSLTNISNLNLACNRMSMYQIKNNSCETYLFVQETVK